MWASSVVFIFFFIVTVVLLRLTSRSAERYRPSVALQEHEYALADRLFTKRKWWDGIVTLLSLIIFFSIPISTFTFFNINDVLLPFHTALFFSDIGTPLAYYTAGAFSVVLMFAMLGIGGIVYHLGERVLFRKQWDLYLRYQATRAYLSVHRRPWDPVAVMISRSEWKYDLERGLFAFRFMARIVFGKRLKTNTALKKSFLIFSTFLLVSTFLFTFVIDEYMVTDEKGIRYNPLDSFGQEHRYSWSDIRSIQFIPASPRGNSHYYISMRDGVMLPQIYVFPYNRHRIEGIIQLFSTKSGVLVTKRTAGSNTPVGL